MSLRCRCSYIRSHNSHYLRQSIPCSCPDQMQLHRYNYGKDSYDLGSGFGHFALAVPDVYKTVDSIKSAGANLVSRNRPQSVLACYEVMQ